MKLMAALAYCDTVSISFRLFKKYFKRKRFFESAFFSGTEWRIYLIFTGSKKAYKNISMLEESRL